MKPTPTLLTVVLAAALAACGDDAATTTPVKVGLLMPISGDLAAFGREFKDAAAIVIDDINEDGGVLGGRPLELVIKDTGTSAAGAMVAFDELRSEGVSAVLGPAASSEVAAIAQRIATSELLTITPSATSPALGAIDFGGNFYRLAASDSVQSTVLAQLIDAATLDNLCIVYRDDAYGRGIFNGVMTQLTSGPTVVTGTYDPTAPDFMGAVGTCGAPVRTGSAKNGILFVTLISDGAAAMDVASSTYGWNPAMGDRVFLTDGTRDADLVSLLANPSFVEGATGTTSRGPDPETPDGAELKAFRARFQELVGRPSDVYSEMAYDAAYVLAMAIELAGTADDIEKIRAALPKISSGTAVSAGDWAAIEAEIQQAGTLDYRGASGAVTLTPPSIEVAGPYYIDVWKIVGGTPTSTEIRKVTP